MRPGFLKGAKSLVSEVKRTPEGNIAGGGQIIGFNLGWDYCAEHERGIDPLVKAFGIPDAPARRSAPLGDLLGADARTITKVPEGLRFYKNLNGYAYLMYSFSPFVGCDSDTEMSADDLNSQLRVYKDEPIWTAWSSNDFGIRVKNDILDSEVMILEQIYHAFLQLDIIMLVEGRPNPFAGGGLVIAIKSRIPEVTLQEMREADEKYLALKEARPVTASQP